jgi:hypothetical protein
MLDVNSLFTSSNLLFVSDIICFKISNPILGKSSMNFLKLSFKSIFNNSLLFIAIILTSFGEGSLLKPHSHKKSQDFKIESCFLSSPLTFFSIDKTQFFITYKLLSKSHSLNKNSHFFSMIFSKNGLFSNIFIFFLIGLSFDDSIFNISTFDFISSIHSK